MIKELDFFTSDIVLNDQIVHIRPVSSEELKAEAQFVDQLPESDRYGQLLSGIKGLSEEVAGGYCEIDFDKKMAFMAVVRTVDGQEQTVGFARYVTDEFDYCESVIAIDDDWYEHGLGQALLQTLFEFARHTKKKMVYVVDLAENFHMRVIGRDLGMDAQRGHIDPMQIRYELFL